MKSPFVSVTIYLLFKTLMILAIDETFVNLSELQTKPIQQHPVVYRVILNNRRSDNGISGYYTDRRPLFLDDRLESEHGVFDRDLELGQAFLDQSTTTTERPRLKKKFVYLASSNDKVHFNSGFYTVNNPHGAADNDNDRFKDKLNEFMESAGVLTKRPGKGNTTSYKDHLTHETSSLSSPNNNYYGGIRPQTTTETYTERPSGYGADKAQKDRFQTRNRLNRMLRQFLVKMHKKRYGVDGSETYRFDDEKVHNPRPNLNIKDTSAVGTGKTFNSYTFDKYFANIDRNSYVNHDRSESKFLAEPLAQIKNKTIKFANKFLSLFTVIQFENFKCQATNAMGNYEGTCYLPNECEEMMGTALGQCASGHGVCCVYKATCGSTSNQNCTYFESPNYPDYYPGGGVVIPPTGTTISPNPTPDPRDKLLYDIVESGEYSSLESRQSPGADLGNALACAISISKFSDDVTQMRIDFIDLELKGPTNGTCIDERLVITGTNINNQIPTICGYNTGSHVYVDVTGLSGPLMLQVLSSVIERKRFKIRICQFVTNCMGGSGCLQYYTGLEGYISTFNYDKAATFSRSDPGYFNNLNYAICIRREPGYCTVTYSTTDPLGSNYPFQLDNFDDIGMRTVPVGQAGAGVFNCPDDYIVLNGIRLCGQRLNDGSVTADFTRNAPVTDFSNGPIIIPVRTTARNVGRGFKLFYMQNRCR